MASVEALRRLIGEASSDPLEVVLNAVDDGITAQAPDGKLLWANHAAAVLCGYESTEQLLEVSSQELTTRFRVSDEFGQPIGVDRLPGKAALAGDKGPEQLVQWDVPQGESRWLLISAHPVFDDSGAIAFAVNVFRDVTERQRTMQAFRESQLRVAELYKEQMDAARSLSKALLPIELPTIPGMDLSSWFDAATGGIGGDFYDAVQLRDGRWLLTIADVSGKGASAASLTAMTRHSLRALARRHVDVTDLFEDLNATLYDEFPEGKFCTMASVALHLEDKHATASFVLAGHPQPMVLSPQGEMIRCGHGELPLGVVPEQKFNQHLMALGPGDSILLYTDGCVGEGAEAGVVLQPVVTSAGASSEVLVKAVRQVAQQTQREHPDDCAALIARIKPD